MEFSTGISTTFDRTFNFDAVENYNNFLRNNSSFIFNNEISTDFEKTLENASESYALKDKNDAQGMGNFVDKLSSTLSNSLNTINNTRLEADKMQEDLAMGKDVNIHDAMIAAEKASLSMQMAIQVRNRILTAYNEITSMGI